MITGMLFLGILAAWAVTTSLTVIPALQASRIPAAEALTHLLQLENLCSFPIRN